MSGLTFEEQVKNDMEKFGLKPEFLLMAGELAKKMQQNGITKFKSILNNFDQIKSVSLFPEMYEGKPRKMTLGYLSDYGYANLRKCLFELADINKQ